MENMGSDSRIYKRLHKIKTCRKTGKCSYCGWHKGENRRKNGHDKRIINRKKGGKHV